jgi:hypothetical protein
VRVTPRAVFYCAGRIEAGAERSSEGHIGLQAAVNLRRGVARADSAFLLDPCRQRGNPAGSKSAESIDHMVVQADKTQSATVGIQIRGEVMKADEFLKVAPRQAAGLDVRRCQHAVRDGLRCNPCQHRSPVVESELGEGYDGERE